MTTDPKCEPCRDGHHRKCVVMMRWVYLRTNYMRCQCDRYGHPPTAIAQADRPPRVMLTNNGGPPEPATGTNTVVLDALREPLP